MLKRAYSQAKLLSILILSGIRYIYIYGTESKLPAYLQTSSILSISFNSVLAVKVWLWFFQFIIFSITFFEK